MKKYIFIIITIIFLFGQLYSADSLRTRNSLETLFADNVSGQISAQDLRDFLKSLFVIKDDDTLFWSTDTYIDSASAEELQNWTNAIDEFSTDGTLAGNSDSVVPTEKATKTYVDNNAGGGGAADSSYVSFEVTDSLYANKSTIDTLSVGWQLNGARSAVQLVWYDSGIQDTIVQSININWAFDTTIEADSTIKLHNLPRGNLTGIAQCDSSGIIAKFWSESGCGYITLYDTSWNKINPTTMGNAKVSVMMWGN